MNQLWIHKHIIAIFIRNITINAMRIALIKNPRPEDFTTIRPQHYNNTNVSINY